MTNFAISDLTPFKDNNFLNFYEIMKRLLFYRKMQLFQLPTIFFLCR